MSDDEPGARPSSLSWGAIARGGLVGFGGSFVVIGLIAFLRHNIEGFAGSRAETAVSLLILLAYFGGGYFSADLQTRFPATTGAVAGIAIALADWAVSVVVWFAHRPQHFLQGPQREQRGIALLGPLIFGAIVAALGGFSAGARSRPRRRVGRDDPPGISDS